MRFPSVAIRPMIQRGSFETTQRFREVEQTRGIVLQQQHNFKSITSGASSKASSNQCHRFRDYILCAHPGMCIDRALGFEDHLGCSDGPSAMIVAPANSSFIAN